MNCDRLLIYREHKNALWSTLVGMSDKLYIPVVSQLDNEKISEFQNYDHNDNNRHYTVNKWHFHVNGTVASRKIINFNILHNKRHESSIFEMRLHFFDM